MANLKDKEPVTNEVDFDHLMLMACEALDGIDYQQLKRILKILCPDLTIRAVKGSLEKYTVTHHPD